jgi:hypothetical protein
LSQRKGRGNREQGTGEFKTLKHIDEEAKKFYVERCSFSPSPVHPLTLMVRLADVKKSFG